VKDLDPKPMMYRLDELARLASESEFVSERLCIDRIDVILFDECRFAFCDLVAEEDTLVGFGGTHTRNRLALRTGFRLALVGCRAARG